MSEQTLNLAVAVGIPSFVVLVGILVNNRLIEQISKRFDDHRVHIDQRFNALEKLIDARFQHQDERLRRVEEVLDARLATIERELKMR